MFKEDIREGVISNQKILVFYVFTAHSASKMMKIAFFVGGVIFNQNILVFYDFSSAHSAVKTLKTIEL